MTKAISGLTLTKVKGSATKDRPGFWLFVAALALLPIDQMVLPFNLKIVDVVLVLLMIYGLIGAWQARQVLVFPLLVPIWLILFSSLVATLVGLASINSLIAIVQEVYLFAWFIVLTNLLITFSASDIDRLMKIWSLIAASEALTTLMGMLRIGPRMFYVSFFATDPQRERVISAAGFSRGVGTYINPNAAAAYLSISLFVLLATSWPLWTRASLGAWLLVGIFSTGSLGGLISAILSSVVLLVLFYVLNNKQALLVGLVVACFGVGVFATLLLIALTFQLQGASGSWGESVRLLALTLGRLPRSLAGRLDVIVKAWPIYLRYPWGMGPDSFASLALSLHNDYVAFLFERGPLGFLGWLGIVFAGLLAPLQVVKHSLDKFIRWRMLALGAGFLSCLLNAFSHEISHFRQLWLLLAFLFALRRLYESQSTAVPVRENLRKEPV